nr:acyltransferase [uncultured Flavobacterium sp.]
MSETNLKSLNLNNRIAILDGFRALAILSVIFYHYFYRWNNPVTPYDGAEFFHYGFRGVPFFFMISGFVICYSLEGTESRIVFWKKRFIRLFPSMFIASVLTFVFLSLFDKSKMFEDSNQIHNLITSITFLPPNVYDLLFGTRNYFSYINFSYWSLWPEIQFYFLASTIYFLDKISFKRNFIIVCIALMLLYNTILFFNLNQIKFLEKAINLFNLIKHLSFFLSGALFYMLYRKSNHYVYLLFLLFAYLSANLSLSIPELIATAIMFGLFFCLIYCPGILTIFKNKILAAIGFSSYFLYLIHENIGVVWILKIVPFFRSNSFIAPVLIIIFMTLFSVFYTNTIESKIIKYLNKTLLKKKI